MPDIYDYQQPQGEAAPAQPTDIYSYSGSVSAPPMTAAKPYRGPFSDALQNAKVAALGELKGAWDLAVEGPAQFINRGLATAFPGSSFVKNQLEIGEQGRQARQEAFESAVQGHEQAAQIGTVAGNVIGSAGVAKAVLGDLPAGANLFNRLIYNAKAGAVIGGAMPVEDPEKSFWGTKATQVGAGGIFGTVGGLAGEAIGWAGGKIATGAVNAWRSMFGNSAPEVLNSIPDVAERVAGASPDIQQTVSDALGSKKPLNTTALKNQLAWDSLPVKNAPLMRGQALEDPVQISLERNARGMPDNPVPQILKGQSDSLHASLDSVKANVAPDVSAADNYEAAQQLIPRIQAKIDANAAATKAAYKALADANGGNMPFDGASFADTATKALATDKSEVFLPSQYRTMLDQYRAGESMTLNDFENWRTMLGNTQRSLSSNPQADGNVLHAVTVVRNALENMPVTEAAAPVKALADAARATAKIGFDLERDVPAYRAVSWKQAEPDTFIKRYITGGDTSDVAALATRVINDDPTALQLVKASYVNDLQDAAGRNGQNFLNNAYNNKLKSFGIVSRKLDTVFSPDEAQTLRTIGEAARIVNVRPAGSFVNESNTAVALPHIAGMLEGSANAAARGLPVGTIARQWLANRSTQQSAAERIAEAIAPGAGIADASPFETFMSKRFPGIASQAGGIPAAAVLGQGLQREKQAGE
jgi:hypothetical protein